MWYNLTKEELETVQKLFGKKSIAGGLSVDYMLFNCTACGNKVHLTYKGWEGADTIPLEFVRDWGQCIPYFTFECKKCGNKGRFKVGPDFVHGLPRKPGSPDN